MNIFYLADVIPIVGQSTTGTRMPQGTLKAISLK